MHDQNTAPRPIHSSLGEKKFWADNLLQMIAGLPVSAVERSFKMGPQSLLSNRFLVGLSPAIWQRISWGEMITRLGMPPHPQHVVLHSSRTGQRFDSTCN